MNVQRIPNYIDMGTLVVAKFLVGGLVCLQRSIDFDLSFVCQPNPLHRIHSYIICNRSERANVANGEEDQVVSF